MFQDFSSPKAPVSAQSRLEPLRAWMAAHNLTAVVVPHADEQNNEYLPVDKERLAWLSGFTGSAGSAIVTTNDAVIFVDGRYTLQAANQTDGDHWQVESLIDFPPNKWISANLTPSDTFAFDPWLHPGAQVKAFNKACADAGCASVELDENPIDAIWHDQPDTPLEPTRLHDFKYAGKITRHKLQEVQASLIADGADLTVLTDPASVCWLFNIRGQDVAHTPLSLSHAIVFSDKEPEVFIDQRKLDIETKAFLTQVCAMHPPSELHERFSDHAAGKKVLIDTAITAYGFSKLVTEADGTVVEGKDPVSLPRAIKNDVELDGARQAHIRDGAAMVNFLAWLDQQPPGTVDEIAAATHLEQTRANVIGDFPLREISFDTISGSGPHGAIVHYRVNEQTNRTLQDGELYLCDSGAQYFDGTTDITRTVAIGNVGEEERHAFTLVLRGHIALALARFPKGTRGMDLDPIARLPLWQHGMDYAHGTGHGVGSYLSVHEGPQNLSKRGTQELLPGMILSNEPGYYVEGKFGIRIENLVIVSSGDETEDGKQAMLGFETITLCPIDKRLIDPTMMTDAELHWLNAYHGWVRKTLEPKVTDSVAKWLRDATEPLVQNLPPASA